MVTNLQFKLLSRAEEDIIYEKCLEHLSTKGVKVEHGEALDILDKAGAWVDFDSQQVRFPRDVIEASLAKVPHDFTLAGSDNSCDVTIPHPSGAFYTATCAEPMRYLNPDSNTYCDVTLAEIAEWGQLVSALDEIDICGYLTPTDVPPKTTDIHALKALFENTPKHIMVHPYSLNSIEYLLELALVVAGDAETLKNKSVISMVTTSLTPFTFKTMDMEIMIKCCRYGVPIHHATLPTSGGTCPITIAGTVLLSSIEIFAGLIMSQLIQPGTPIIGSPLVWTLNMLTGSILMGSVEAALGTAATAQFIRTTCGAPVNASGLYVDSYLPDGQSMTEATIMGLLASMGGSDIINGAGRMGGSGTVSPIKLILDNSLASIIKRVVSGVKVNDDTLAWQEIVNTAPGGQFMDREHTLLHCREALYPELFARQPIEDWNAEGRKDIYARAVEKYRELKKDVQPRYMTEDVQREMIRVVKQADKHLAK